MQVHLTLAAGVFGLAGSVALAVPALWTIDSRETLLRASRLKLTIADPSELKTQEDALLGQALEEIQVERRWLRRGLLLIGLSFLMLIAEALTSVAT